MTCVRCCIATDSASTPMHSGARGCVCVFLPWAFPFRVALVVEVVLTLQIHGVFFLMLTDAMLEHDLGISNAFHRAKILAEQRRLKRAGPS